ncbi:TPA: hypothetical protein HMU51_00435 [Escherichia coli]|nr:hypothetical protein CRN68_02420 [Escherichia coli]ATX44062.1 hypothetical protein AM333_21550 [Escherichia coli]ATX55748.1 hypothetical protein AM342_03550 [Escherichia coli]AVU60200.1 hypothetical protein A9P13_09500 [Escherichia coli]AXZ85581.1 hypothetical protein AM446_10505 [Escherichia coli]
MTDSRLVTWFSRQMRLHQNRLMKRAGEAGKALRAGGGADFIFSASERVVMAFRLCVGALVCLRGVLCGGERVRA